MMSMSGPTWLADFFAALMLAVAIYSVARLLAARLWQRPTHLEIDGTHVVMGTTMTGMLVNQLSFFSAGLWEVVFGLLAALFAYKTYQAVSGAIDHHSSHYATHLIMAGGMIYMYAAPSTDTVRWIPLLFVVALLLSGIRELDAAPVPARLTIAPRDTQPALIATGGGSSPASPDPVVDPGSSTSRTADNAWLAPGLERASHIATCITMGYMLILML
jgi:hypothetical protein